MVTKIQTVELQANTNVVVCGRGSVTLTANLSDLELENITARNGRLEYVVGDRPGQRQITPDAHDPRLARWRREARDDGGSIPRDGRWSSAEKPQRSVKQGSTSSAVRREQRQLELESTTKRTSKKAR